MEILLIFSVIFNLIFIVSCLRLNKLIDEKPVVEEEKPKLSEEEKEKQQKLRENFEELMGYDYDRALGRK